MLVFIELVFTNLLIRLYWVFNLISFNSFFIGSYDYLEINDINSVYSGPFGVRMERQSLMSVASHDIGGTGVFSFSRSFGLSWTDFTLARVMWGMKFFS